MTILYTILFIISIHCFLKLLNLNTSIPFQNDYSWKRSPLLLPLDYSKFKETGYMYIRFKNLQFFHRFYSIRHTFAILWKLLFLLKTYNVCLSFLVEKMLHFSQIYKNIYI